MIVRISCTVSSDDAAKGVILMLKLALHLADCALQSMLFPHWQLAYTVIITRRVIQRLLLPVTVIRLSSTTCVSVVTPTLILWTITDAIAYAQHLIMAAFGHTVSTTFPHR